MERLALMEYSIEEDPEEGLTKGARETRVKSRLTAEVAGDEEFLSIVTKLDTYPRHIRSFVLQRMSKELHQDITDALQNRALKVPRLAKRYGVSEPEMNLALDIIDLIRQV
jgi:hypothetical protein